MIGRKTKFLYNFILFFSSSESCQAPLKKKTIHPHYLNWANRSPFSQVIRKQFLDDQGNIPSDI